MYNHDFVAVKHKKQSFEVNPKLGTLQKTAKDRNQLRFLFFILVEL
jgi:hypothetical protein